jgi:NADPH:quinone reductase-like Zn-dependent oxidoreductase
MDTPPPFYEIRIAGHLSPQWADWFEGLTITLEEDGSTLLSGPVVDQAALYGLLKKVRDLGMPLVSVNQVQFTKTYPYHSNQGEKRMKAIVQNNYGSPDVLKLAEVAKPAVKDNEVLVRVKAVSINAGDLFTLRGDPWLTRLMVGFPKPKNHILGWDVAGVVESTGSSVTQFRPGDAVYTASGNALAEYVSVADDKLAFKPANLTFEQAAAVPTAAITALQGLRDAGKLQPGQKVLINGASGGVGTFAVQIAKALGAEVTGVCSARNVDMVRSLGADDVVDYTRKDFTQNGRRYDLILDNVASHSFSDLTRVLTPRGLIVPNSGHGGMGYVFKAFLLSPFLRQLGSMYLAESNNKDLTQLKEWIESGKVKPVIDRTYPLGDTSEAFRYLEKEHARGKVVITVTE